MRIPILTAHDFAHRLSGMTERPLYEALDLQCECCHFQRPTTRKYPGIGYYCDDCMNDGCFEDECMAQSQTGPWPEFKKQPDGSYATDRQYAIHQRLAAE